MALNLSDFGTTPLADDVDVANLPEQMGGARTPPPPSGTYLFQLPRLTVANFEKLETKEHGDRVSVVFNEDAPLQILQAPPSAQAYVGLPFETRLNNAPRKRGKGDTAAMASDWDYLNRALGETDRPKSNAEFVTRLIARSEQGATFKADVEGRYYCNPKRDARFAQEGGGFQPVVNAEAPADAEGKQPNIQGCGARYYEGNEDKAPTGVGQPGAKSGSVAKRAVYGGEDGQQLIGNEYPNSITCLHCGADVRRFADLTRFQPA